MGRPTGTQSLEHVDSSVQSYPREDVFGDTKYDQASFISLIFLDAFFSKASWTSEASILCLEFYNYGVSFP